MSSKRRRHNKRNQRNRKNRHRHRQQTSKKVFEIGAYICIRKQRKGVGFVKKTGDKNSYLIAFKNGKYGWYRSTKINLITDQEYNNASSQFIINKNLPSPSPTPTPSMSYSPSPSPINNQIIDTQTVENIYKHQQIKFTESKQTNDIDNTNNTENILEQPQESKIEIKIQQISDENKSEQSASEPRPLTDSNKQIEITHSEIKSIQTIGDDEKKQHIQNEVAVSSEIGIENSQKTQNIQITDSEIKLMQNTAIDDTKHSYRNNDKNIKDTKKEKKSKDGKKKKKQKKEKIITPKISKFEKKMKLYYKVKDLRERSFLIMCDENKMIDLKSLYEYIAHFGNIKPVKSKVKEFLDFMKPNVNNVVSFSKFVKAIDDDGDVIAAFQRFKKCGKARSKK